MAAYFARRLVDGVVTFFLAGFIMYSLVLYIPGGASNWINWIIYDHGCCSTTQAQRELSKAQGQERLRDMRLDKPWPVNYAAWLFDPSRTTIVAANYEDGILLGPIEVPYGLDIDLFGLHLKGSGVLVGNLRSMEINRGEQVTNMLGPGLGEFLLLLPLTLFASMAFALVQRHRRPRINDMLYSPPSSKLLVEYRQGLRIPSSL